MTNPHDKPMEILVADAREDLRWLYNHWLRADGFRVSLARDRAELDQLLERNIPDLILLDLHMQGLEGLRICRWLKNDPRYSHIPVVATTHETATLAARLIQTSEADGILGKPFSRIELEMELERHLDKTSDALGRGAGSGPVKEPGLANNTPTQWEDGTC